MTAPTINEIVGRLARIGALEVAGFEKLLATTFKQGESNPYWSFYEFELQGGPFARGEFRLSKEGNKALLSLWPRDELALSEKGIDLGSWGQVRNIDVNPRIPPEGTDAYIYEAQGVRVSFQFTHNSRRLRSVALEWGGA